MITDNFMWSKVSNLAHCPVPVTRVTPIIGVQPHRGNRTNYFFPNLRLLVSFFLNLLKRI